MGVHPSDDPLAGVAMFSGLDSESRKQIAEVAVPRRYLRGRLLFFEGEPGESLIMIRSGAVSVFRTAATGERAMLHVARAPEVLGEVSLLDGSRRSASAEALEEVEALALSRTSFLELVHASPHMLDAVLRSMGAIVRRLTEQSSDHVFLDLPGRVAKTLVRLTDQRRNSQFPTIELNQTQLAEMAGGSRQSVNQAIGIFSSRGWLRTEGRKILILDLAALRKRAGFSEQ
ncbi:Crp/Fnr family transcriptional regulator [Haloglycomyces albus]|uniref:Crp/Fnr family transcriptional regulator n=1 Tax=Haloglycomyces albus TaxID=526067 RepID=UPI001B7F7F87|nr:Crp/Fnr family transcriptional regulator [Haloglycomyces albus]